MPPLFSQIALSWTVTTWLAYTHYITVNLTTFGQKPRKYGNKSPIQQYRNLPYPIHKISMYSVSNSLVVIAELSHGTKRQKENTRRTKGQRRKIKRTYWMSKKNPKFWNQYTTFINKWSLRETTDFMKKALHSIKNSTLREALGGKYIYQIA